MELKKLQQLTESTGSINMNNAKEYIFKKTPWSYHFWVRFKKTEDIDELMPEIYDIVNEYGELVDESNQEGVNRIQVSVNKERPRNFLYLLFALNDLTGGVGIKSSQDNSYCSIRKFIDLISQ